MPRRHGPNNVLDFENQVSFPGNEYLIIRLFYQFHENYPQLLFLCILHRDVLTLFFPGSFGYDLVEISHHDPLGNDV